MIVLEMQVLKWYDYGNGMIRDWMLEVFKIVLEPHW